MSKKQFVMSMFTSDKELYKAKCEYLERENEKLINIVLAARDLYLKFGEDGSDTRHRRLFLSLVAAEVLDPTH